jgi:hypothetical protein
MWMVVPSGMWPRVLRQKFEVTSKKCTVPTFRIQNMVRKHQEKPLRTSCFSSRSLMWESPIHRKCTDLHSSVLWRGCYLSLRNRLYLSVLIVITFFGVHSLYTSLPTRWVETCWQYGKQSGWWQHVVCSSAFIFYHLASTLLMTDLCEQFRFNFRSRKPRLTAVGIRCADHATPSSRKIWH